MSGAGPNRTLEFQLQVFSCFSVLYKLNRDRSTSMVRIYFAGKEPACPVQVLALSYAIMKIVDVPFKGSITNVNYTGRWKKREKKVRAR